MKARPSLASLVAIVSLLTAPGVALAVYEFPICTAPRDQSGPAISGNIVVWTDGRNAATTGLDIYGYDLSAGREFPICTMPGEQRLSDISGNIVVWRDARAFDASGMDIYAYDLSTGREFAVCTAPGHQDEAAVSGNIVVWTDRRDGTAHIWACDLSTGREFPVCTAPGGQDFPAISGSIVVWRDWRDFWASSLSIYAYDLGAGREFPICVGGGTATMVPAVSGSIVVWDNVDAIRGYDLSSGTHFVVAGEYRTWMVGPHISGTVVVWQQSQAWQNIWDIYGCDLSSGEHFAVCTGPSDQVGARISGDTVVWDDRRNWDVNGVDIYGASVAGLSITKSVDKAIALPGDILTYVLAYENLGAKRVTSAVIADPVPAGTTYVAGSGGAYDASTDCVVFGVGDLPAGAHGCVGFQVVVDTGTPVLHDVCNNAIMTFDQRSVVSNAVTTTIPRPDLYVTKRVEPVLAVAPGGVATYHIDYGNVGTALATGVLISDSLPPSTAYVRGSGGTYDVATNTVSWGIGDVPPGSSGSVSFSVEVDRGVPNGTALQNEARVSSVELPPVASNTVWLTVWQGGGPEKELPGFYGLAGEIVGKAMAGSTSVFAEIENLRGTLQFPEYLALKGFFPGIAIAEWLTITSYLSGPRGVDAACWHFLKHCSDWDICETWLAGISNEEQHAYWYSHIEEFRSLPPFAQVKILEDNPAFKLQVIYRVIAPRLWRASVDLDLALLGW